MTTFIYTLNCPFSLSPRYVGKTNDVVKRLSEHVRKVDLDKSVKSSWVKSILTKGSKPILEIIDKVPVDEWQFWEQHYISLYKSWGFNLTNGTTGGDGNTTHSVESREKIKAKRKLQLNHRTTFSEEEIKASRERLKILHKARIGQKDSIETKEKRGKSVSKALKNRYSDKTISVWNKGLTFPMNFYKNGKPVVQLSLNNEVIEIFSSAREAHKKTGTRFQDIGKCCRKIRVSANGYKWAFEYGLEL